MPNPTPATLASVLEAADVVWFAIEIGWRKRPSDLRSNTKLAERWENTFPMWNVDGRQVTLSDSSYTSVYLGDGVARWHTQTGEGYQRIRELMPQLLEALRDGERDNLRVQISAQSLRPMELAFEKLVSHLSAHVLNGSFLPSLGANTIDFAYLADTTVNGQWIQLNFGPVTGREVPFRVNAKDIRIPPVAIYLNVTGRASLSSASVEEIERPIRKVIEVGISTIKRLSS